ncbi:MAG: hypothetical protein Q8N51_03535 [Gammaproteobacteria bacterium]|nr:hypothetical protein [Gammaproteobacteria bacterium]
MAIEIVSQAPHSSGDPDHSDPATFNPSEPLFKAHQLFEPAIDNVDLPGREMRRFVTEAIAVATGVECVLNLMADDELRAGNREFADTPAREQDRPLMSPFDLDALRSLARASLAMLATDGENVMRWAYERHTPEGIAERKRFEQWGQKNG